MREDRCRGRRPANGSVAASKAFTNVVFMGMGEPLANYDNTMSAIRAINDPHGSGRGSEAHHIVHRGSCTPNCAFGA